MKKSRFRHIREVLQLFVLSYFAIIGISVTYDYLFYRQEFLQDFTGTIIKSGFLAIVLTWFNMVRAGIEVEEKASVE